MTKIFSLAGAILFFSIGIVNGQNSGIIAGQDTSRRVIVTAVPFLAITPDARSGAMGDVGAAISADANSNYWNPAKLAFNENKFGASLSYTPWLSKIIDDMFIGYLTAYRKLDRTQAIALSLRYFDLGDINLTDNDGNDIGRFSPREFSISVTYSRKLSEQWGIGANARFIHSNISNNVAIQESQAGTSVAVDLSTYFNKDIMFTGKNANLAFGAVISNIGSKITYNSSSNKDFIPINLRIGTALTMEIDPYNSITFAFDINKLLVPTPPIYEFNTDGSIATDPNGDPIIARGKDPNRSLLSGMFGSFGDAPDGFSEELQEIMFAFGIEYWYQDVFAARAGYFYENTIKGTRRYFTMGIGFRYQKLGFDFAYLIPQIQNHPLAETLRFTLHFNFIEDDNKPIIDE